MTNEELANELERLGKGSTPGHWRAGVKRKGDVGTSPHLMGPEWHHIALTAPGQGVYCATTGGVFSSNDGLLIEALHNNLPAIISALRENARLREALAWYANKENWGPDYGPVDDDCGDRAIAALRQLDTPNMSNTP